MPHLILVGRTRDACSRKNVVTFQGDSGEVRVSAGEMHQVDLPALTTEFTWYCSGTRERVANDEPFETVQCERARNGAIQWVFYRKI